MGQGSALTTVGLFAAEPTGSGVRCHWGCHALHPIQRRPAVDGVAEDALGGRQRDAPHMPRVALGQHLDGPLAIFIGAQGSRQAVRMIPERSGDHMVRPFQLFAQRQACGSLVLLG
ncbi:hypothetical protein [Limnohabitans sp. T6-5]|uniref:hypothetical protein n=1 Tax=Limnohabitans sp. T6-5 TaxID=1100724 RepID=UPI0013048B77|nr:hypothetical protein [Limnohabitans sp. T6-5]